MVSQVTEPLTTKRKDVLVIRIWKLDPIDVFLRDQLRESQIDRLPVPSGKQGQMVDGAKAQLVDVSEYFEIGVADRCRHS